MGNIQWKSKDVFDAEKTEEEKQSEIAALKKYLQDTDFYYARQQETGKVVPQAVKDQRIITRQRLNDLGL